MRSLVSVGFRQRCRYLDHRPLLCQGGLCPLPEEISGLRPQVLGIAADTSEPTQTIPMAVVIRCNFAHPGTYVFEVGFESRVYSPRDQSYGAEYMRAIGNLMMIDR